MQTKIMTKVAAVATGLAMATSVLSLAPMAHAASLTPAQVDSIVSFLVQFGADSATIANVRSALSGGPVTPAAGGSMTTSASCSAISQPLTIGSSGASVSALQTILVAGGHLVMPAGVNMGTFGPLTKAAVIKWQMSAGVMPASGYFGPISLAALMRSPACMVATVPPPGTTPGTTPGTLAGTDGSISDVSALGSFNNEDVAEGNNDVKILGADVEVSNDGDIALKSVKVSFDPGATSGSTRLNKYIDSVSIWLGSEKIGSASVDDFTKNNDDTYSKTISLSGATTIKADKIAKLYVAVDAANTIDSNDISGDHWTVNIDNIRFVDGSGVFTTDSSSGDLDAGLNIPINFVAFSTAADTELTITTASDSPDAGIVVVRDNANTDNVSLLKGKIKLDGTSDALLNEFPVTLTAEASSTQAVSAITGSVTLKIGDQEFTESVSSSSNSATVVFNNLDFSLDAGKTVSFEVLADVNDIDAGVFDEGNSLKADVTSTNRNYIDVENSEGDQLDDSSEKSGTATGEAQEFRTSGIMLSLVSASGPTPDNSNPNDDLGTFTLKFKVTAVGDTVYVSSLADAQLSGNTNGKTTILVDRAGTATVGGVTASIENDTDTTLNTAGLWEIAENDSETLILTTTVQLPAAGLGGVYHAILGGVRWTTDATDATPNNSYTSNLDSFKATGTLN